MERQAVLVIDDEPSVRHMLRLVLEREGYRVGEADGGEGGLAALAADPYDVVLCDIRMPGLDGLGFLRHFRERGLPATVIMMSAYGSVDTAIECMKHGAYDYIAKPFKPDEVVLTLRKAEERIGLRRENVRLRQELAQKGGGNSRIIGGSAGMARLLDQVRAVADSGSSVLILGETGTGKELIARALHQHSPRRQGPFIPLNCGAMAAGLIESELFGHARGAFTGADREHKGLFVAADGGTLFLDEIGELPLELQPKLLRVLQEGEVRRLGESRPRQVNVRVLAATARDLKAEMAAGRFRDDLYYRLAVIDLHLPPLRERREDIPLLAEHFVARIAFRDGRQVSKLTPDALAALQEYAWPGNVRELENFMEKVMIFCRGTRIDLASLPWEVRRNPREPQDAFSLKQAIERMEREYLRKALAATGGNRTQAARLLEISLRALQYKLKEYGLG